MIRSVVAFSTPALLAFSLWNVKRPAVKEKATTVLAFDVAVIPGLLQAPDRARVILQLNRYAPFDLKEQVRSRLEAATIELIGREMRK